MHVFFEDDGAFKAGTVLADNDASLQVEAISGKRLKIKAANVLLRFDDRRLRSCSPDAWSTPPASIPISFGEGDAEFGFADLARDYFGRSPLPSEAAALALRLHASPMHFYKKGKGRYKAAPAEALRAARAGVERKRRESDEVAAFTAELLAHRLPPAMAAKLSMLLYKPDKLSLEARALAAACEAARTSPLALLEACGAIPSTHDYHFNRFLFEAFPRGVGFPDVDDPPAIPALPLAPVRAFSIDDASTTEDRRRPRCVTRQMERRDRHHIAAPALSISRGSPLDAIARARLSTVYMPGRKITMLPEPVRRRRWPGTEACCAFALCRSDARRGPSSGKRRAPSASPSRPTCASTRSASASRRTRLPPTPSGRMSCVRSGASRESSKRPAARPTFSGPTTTSIVDRDAPDGRQDRDLLPRPRGSPLDKLVAEPMIFTSTATRRFVLADAGVPGLYRTQQGGKVRMSTLPEPHQGLGVAQYLWASSPLRRYSDLVNQRQLIAILNGGAPAYVVRRCRAGRSWPTSFHPPAICRAASLAEHHWCLRWLLQEKIEERGRQPSSPSNPRPTAFRCTFAS